MNNGTEPRSSRLKDKMKGEGEVMIKKFFVENVIQNNDLLYSLADLGSSCVVLPRNKFDVAFSFNSRMRSQMKIKPKPALNLGSQEEALEASSDILSDDHMLDRNLLSDDLSPFSREQSPVQDDHQKINSCLKGRKSEQTDENSNLDSLNLESGKANTHKCDMLLDQGLLSCVTCGILSFACVAIVRPTDAAAMHLMSSDCSSFIGPSDALGAISGTENDRFLTNMGPTESGTIKKNDCNGFDDILVHSSNHKFNVQDMRNNLVSKSPVQAGASALDLLASVYGNDSDLEDEGPQLCVIENVTVEPSMKHSPDHSGKLCDPSSPRDLQSLGPESHNEAIWMSTHPSSKSVCDNDSAEEFGVSDIRAKECQQVLKFYSRKHSKNNKSTAQDVTLNGENVEILGGLGNPYPTPKESYNSCWDPDKDCQSDKNERPDFRNEKSPSPPNSVFDSDAKISKHGNLTTQCRNKFGVSGENACVPSIQRPDKDSCRMHVFCLEHALDVQKQLLPVGGVNVMLLCHPDYAVIESQAKLMADELAIDYTWKDIHFREATEEDLGTIESALADEEAVPVNSDWAVKMGVNLYYSVSLSKSPLYSKQLPYNAVIYKAFGRTSTGESPRKLKVFERRKGRKKKIVVSGRWCGKVWMSNQVHPYLAYKDDSEDYEPEEADYQQHEVDSEYEQPMTMDHSFDVAHEPVRKSTGRWKKPSRESSVKKPKNRRHETNRSLQEEEEFSDGSMETDYQQLEVDSEHEQPMAIKNSFNVAHKPVKKSTGKRKKPLNESSVKKPKHRRCETYRSLQEEEDFSDDSLGECIRLLRGEHRKHHATPEFRKYEKAVHLAKDSEDDDLEVDSSPRPRKPSKSKVLNTPKYEKAVHRAIDSDDDLEVGSSTRPRKPSKSKVVNTQKSISEKPVQKKAKKTSGKDEVEEYVCDMEGCSMSFSTKHDLVLHKRNICPVKGCGKKFFSHKYLVQHRKVHLDDRPLKCPWKGCNMSFKWAWARTEHIRVHTGDRPYICMAGGCGQTFRFVSDFSRHKRKTGHVSKKGYR